MSAGCPFIGLVLGGLACSGCQPFASCSAVGSNSLVVSVDPALSDGVLTSEGAACGEPFCTLDHFPQGCDQWEMSFGGQPWDVCTVTLTIMDELGEPDIVIERTVELVYDDCGNSVSKYITIEPSDAEARGLSPEHPRPRGRATDEYVENMQRAAAERDLRGDRMHGGGRDRTG